MESRSILLVLCLLACAQSRTYTRCELVTLLREWGSNMVATWTCMASYETNYNSAYISGPLPDGSYTHGIWKIDDNNWCYNPLHPPSLEANGCQTDCLNLRSDDLSFIWACATIIESRWTFYYWPSWVFYCNTAEEEVEWTTGC